MLDDSPKIFSTSLFDIAQLTTTNVVSSVIQKLYIPTEDKATNISFEPLEIKYLYHMWTSTSSHEKRFTNDTAHWSSICRSSCCICQMKISIYALTWCSQSLLRPVCRIGCSWIYLWEAYTAHGDKIVFLPKINLHASNSQLDYQHLHWAH